MASTFANGFGEPSGKNDVKEQPRRDGSRTPRFQLESSALYLTYDPRFLFSLVLAEDRERSSQIRKSVGLLASGKNRNSER